MKLKDIVNQMRVKKYKVRNSGKSATIFFKTKGMI